MHIAINDISPETTFFALHFCGRKYRCVFNHFHEMGPKITEFGVIAQHGDHYAVQGHSRSPILLPVKAHMRLLISDNTNLYPILHRFQAMADY